MVLNNNEIIFPKLMPWELRMNCPKRTSLLLIKRGGWLGDIPSLFIEKFMCCKLSTLASSHVIWEACEHWAQWSMSTMSNKQQIIETKHPHILDASINRHFALSIQSWVHCPYLDRGSFQDISTLNVHKIFCSMLCKFFIPARLQ